MLRFALLMLGAVLAYMWLERPATIAAVDPSGGFSYPGYTIEALAPFDLEGRVLSRRDYNGDREAELSPTDLAMGWGAVDTPAVLEALKVSQRNRWYFWRADSLPVTPREVSVQSANMHMIPANPEAAAALDAVSADDRVRIIGTLVEVRGNDGWRWRSSLTREDTGSGACEVVLLERLVVLS